MNNKYNFDAVIPRRGSDSVKWNKYANDVLPLWVADMDFPSPPQIIQVLQERISHPFFGYGSGDDELLEIICDWVKQRHHWEIKPEWLLLVPGVITGMNWAIQSVLLGDGRKISYQTPIYPPFLEFAKNAGAEAVEIPLIDTGLGYRVDFNLFEQQLPESGVFALCNPHNPTGRVFTEAELEHIAAICLSKNVLICSDEIHCDLVFSGQRHIPIASLSPELAECTITLMAPSKTFNIPGLKFSFAIVPNDELRARMEKKRQGLVGHPNVLAFHAAKAAYLYGADWLDEVLVYLEYNRDYLSDYLARNLPHVKCNLPEGTYLAWLDCRGLKLGKDPYHFFLEQAKVALNNGSDFGKDGVGFVRLNFATPRCLLSQALGKISDSIKILDK